jgi:hypothetical protein
MSDDSTIAMAKSTMPGRVKTHAGPIHSAVAGRTDHLPMQVAAGSYVLPADIVSAMGEGNTMAGFKSAKSLFGGTPGESSFDEGAPGEQAFANGGAAQGVPIVAAGGEYVIGPEDVARLGQRHGGDINDGHKILDHFVRKYRAKTVQLLKSLPGPKKD